MNMRIIYVVPAPMGRTPEGAAELARRGTVLREYAARGTEIDIVDVHQGPASIESMYEEYISIPATAERILEAEEQGYDAAIVGCFGDPGLDAFRELTEMLVVGPGEASFLAAAMLGHSFSVITVTASVVASTKKEVRNAGVGDKLTSVRVVETPVLELARDRGATLEKLVAEGRQALDIDGADTLVLGCMTMGFLGVAEELSDRLGVPVVNPSRWCLKMTEAMAGAGYSHSKRAYMTPPKLAMGLVSSKRNLLVSHAD
jgi:allantoin racemase